MSSQAASSHVAPATPRPAAPSLGATIRRLVRVVWRSYERHSLYQVMLAAGRDDSLPDDLIRSPRRAGQH